MQKVNNSKDKPYYTQRNNRLKPYGACNVTSVIAALSAAGWPVKRLATDEDGQPEDALMRFILSDGETLALWRKLDPIGRHDANEWHPVIEFGENWEIRDIEKIIMDGGAFVASGVFAAEGKKTIGHVVAVVGFRTDEDGSVTHFVLDDSWGDYRTEYKIQNGNDVEMPAADFMKLLRPCGFPIKMGHKVNPFKSFQGGNI